MTSIPWKNPPTLTDLALPQTETVLNAYLATLPKGWHLVTAKELHQACGSPLTLQMFSRHLASLNIPKRHTSKGTQYALTCP
jgi:hypothetical protein